MPEEKEIEEIHEIEELEVEKLEVEKDVLTEVPEEEAELKPVTVDVSAWKPKTFIGKMVKEGKIKSIEELLSRGVRILEPEIIDVLVPNLQVELIMIGQSRGKFGGGARRVFKQTQKKSPEGNKPRFSCLAVVGNCDGLVGAALGKSKDTVPAREKAVRNAKLEIFKVRRGCGVWECHCKKPHSIPLATVGKCGGSKVVLKPAPRGKGLVCEKETAKVFRLAGIKDIWVNASGRTTHKQNLVFACIEALKKLSRTKILIKAKEQTGLVEGFTSEHPPALPVEGMR